MAALIELSVKRKDGTYDYFTISVNNETNKYAQNVSMFKKQTKEQHDAKVQKEYIGNGRVFWTDGTCVRGKTKEELKAEEEVNQRQAAKADPTYQPFSTPQIAPNSPVDKPYTPEDEDQLPF